MFKNTRLSAFFAAVLLSVTATTALVAAPAFADAPASAAASAPAADAAPAAPAADAAAPAADAAAPAADAAAPAKTEEVHNPFGLQAVWDGGFVPRATLIILAIMSIGSWYIIITKLMDQMKIFKQAKETAAKFWKAPSIAAGSATLEEGSPFRFIAESGTKATAHHDGALLEQIDLSTWVTMSIQRASDKVQSRLQDGLSFLATVGSTAPFIGLFGTVWGIMNSFIGIAKTQTTNLAVVAPGIAEALLATAIGLVAAIPAVVIYNIFARQIGSYKAMLGDVAAQVLLLQSRDLDLNASASAHPVRAAQKLRVG